jgi:3-phytase
VYERTGENELIGEFSVVASDSADRITEPNGIDVIALPLGEQFPDGLFITSDDNNSDPNERNNYKLASWGDVASALNLTITATDPRRVGLVDTVVSDAAPVTAAAETEPVPSGVDAADDPAIWIHPTDPALSTIIATDKTAGLVVYDLDGSVLQAVDIGRVNNVDLRYNFPSGAASENASTALVAATNRTNNSLILYHVNAETRELEFAGETVSDVREVYGVCMYVSPQTGDHYAFVNSAKTGEVEQYRLTGADDGAVNAEVVREFTVGSQTEGCTVDDENSVLYIGEEAVGVWRYGAEPDAGDERVSVDMVGERLTADVEGVALYFNSDGTGYLIVSSQGSSEFAVYTREGDNAYIGKFAILENETIDAVSGSDGLDVTNFPLGNAYPDGLFITQDDLNINPVENQNFKLVSWSDIAEALDLRVDTVFDPREVGRQ